MRRRIQALAVSSLAIVLVISSPATVSTGNAATISTPTFSLDGAISSSLATSSPTVWRDLISGTTSLTFGANTSRSSEGGGSIAVTSAGDSGVYLAPVATGTPSNIVGDMTLMEWVKPTTWNATWNIIASRWFANFAGTGATTDYDYHFSIKSPDGVAHKLNLYTSSASDMYGTYDFSLNKWYLVGFTLSSTGNLQFYVNGKADGSVITGAGHTARSTNYFFVGDLRSGCAACSMTGYIGKFRLWNSVLTPSQISADYKNEAADLGYGSNLSLTLGTPAPLYRISNTITASISGPPSPAGKITFYDNGRVIPGCRSKSVSNSTPSCSWKPNRHGYTKISARYIPNDSDFVNGAIESTYFVTKRATLR